MKKSIIAISLAFMVSSSAHSQTAMAVASEMYPAWNLGNTLEAGPCSWLSDKLDYEIGWQNTRTTQEIIDYVKKSGFRSVRIPCSWFIHMDNNYNIDAKWMDRVQQVVDYCINDGLYVLLNDHYDGGWAETAFANVTESDIRKNCFIMGMMWKQIANRFRDYDNHLLFAGMNEPNAVTDKSDDKAKDVETLIRYEQAFVNAVRQTGGNNKTRILVTQAPCTNIKFGIRIRHHAYRPHSRCHDGRSTLLCTLQLRHDGEGRTMGVQSILLGRRKSRGRVES